MKVPLIQINKNNYSISNEQVKEIKNYIIKTTETTKKLKTSNDLTNILDKYEEDLKNHSKEVKNLQQKIYNRDKKIEELEEDLNYANDRVDELEDKVSKLEKVLDFFKELWQKFIEFLQDKFFASNKYDEFINELYEEKIINKNDMDTIQNKDNIRNKDDDFDR